MGFEARDLFWRMALRRFRGLWHTLLSQPLSHSLLHSIGVFCCSSWRPCRRILSALGISKCKARSDPHEGLPVHNSMHIGFCGCLFLSHFLSRNCFRYGDLRHACMCFLFIVVHIFVKSLVQLLSVNISRR